MKELIQKCLVGTDNRTQFWVNFLNETSAENVLELGVFRGDFAQPVLKQCNNIKHYYMLDSWRHLNNWNKPANKMDDVFEDYFRDTLSKTDFATEKRIILRGKTTEVVDQIPNNHLHLAYIDGDHTLKGIAIDLIRIYPKIKDGGWIGGDDFIPVIWQHGKNYEPSLVFPFAVYFAEAVGATIYGLPYGQFLLEKNQSES